MTMEQREWRLRALSPLDGRYARQMEPFAAVFSEAALIRERFVVEVAWLRRLAAMPEVDELAPLSEGEQSVLDQWVSTFAACDALSVKEIEAVTNHDVKAVEYYLKSRLVEELGWAPERAEFAHFAVTSEDVNNLAYAGMVRRALNEVWLPGADALVNDVRAAAIEHAGLPMLARTHGQPATPTTLGKELAVFVTRWERQLRAIRQVEILGKWGGATGTLAAHVVAYPELDWLVIARRLRHLAGLHMGAADDSGGGTRLDGGAVRRHGSFRSCSHRFLPRYVVLHKPWLPAAKGRPG